MIFRAGNVFICAFTALFVGVVVSATVEAMGNPNLLSHPGWLYEMTLASAVFYIAVPLVILSIVAISGRNVSTALSLLVAVGWLTVIFTWWAYKPWVVYGKFPWWGFKRHYLDMLPVSLSFGLAFTLCLRKTSVPKTP